ncbi:ImuA family protein [Paracoccus rhizosphaerae]|uniref:ImuA family protein n=1 Tax=Paracoccus rhizosphaerae TaxID=1133347 RepID=A0ABV6CRR5_9RHOB|nr:hypothetical protein [Paracoccus rhizosphaerae]
MNKMILAFFAAVIAAMIALQAHAGARHEAPTMPQVHHHSLSGTDGSLGGASAHMQGKARIAVAGTRGLARMPQMDRDNPPLATCVSEGETEGCCLASAQPEGSGMQLLLREAPVVRRKEGTAGAKDDAVATVATTLNARDRELRAQWRLDEASGFHVPSSREYELAVQTVSLGESQLMMPKVHAAAGDAGMSALQLAQASLPLDRVIHLEAGDDRMVLASIEEGLRHGGLAAVVGDVGHLSMTASRQLHLAAEGTGTMGIVLRRWRRQADASDLGLPTAAMTRWRISVPPSAPLPVPGVGRARWLIELIRARAGECLDIELEACNGSGRLGFPADVADRPAAAAGGRISALS